MAGVRVNIYLPKDLIPVTKKFKSFSGQIQTWLRGTVGHGYDVEWLPLKRKHWLAYNRDPDFIQRTIDSHRALLDEATNSLAKYDIRRDGLKKVISDYEQDRERYKRTPTFTELRARYNNPALAHHVGILGHLYTLRYLPLLDLLGES